MNAASMDRAFRRTLSAIRYDIVFQWRHGFYYVYAVIVALYIAAIRLAPAGYRGSLAVLLVFSDTSVLGLFFIGGIVLLERSQNTFESLFITPFRVGEYLAAKVTSLTLTALLMSFLVMLGGLGPAFSASLLVLAVAAGSVFFTLLGIMFAARVKSVNGYFGVSILIIPVLMAPLIAFFGLADGRWFSPLPTEASLVLLRGSLEGLTPAAVVCASAVYAVWIVFVWAAAGAWFRKYVLIRTGEEQWKIV